MPHLTDLTGLVGIASAIAAMMLLLPRVNQLPRHYVTTLTAAALIVSLIPFSGLPLAAYVRGMVGDLSITSVVLAWAALLHPYCAEKKSRTPLWILISAAALFLYPMTLGMSLYDPYRLGYSDMLFIAALLVIAGVAWLLQYSTIALCLALATLAWSLGWYESTNLWDYLLDPLVAIYAMSALILRKTNLRLFSGR